MPGADERDLVLKKIQLFVDRHGFTPIEHQAILDSWNRCPKEKRCTMDGNQARRIARGLVLTALGIEGVKKLGIHAVSAIRGYKQTMLAAGMVEADYARLERDIKIEARRDWLASGVDYCVKNAGLPPSVGTATNEVLGSPRILTYPFTKKFFGGSLVRAVVYHVAKEMRILTPESEKYLDISRRLYLKFIAFAGLPSNELDQG